MIQTLYNRRNDGKLQSWTIEVDGNKYRMTSGIVGGKTVTSTWTICTSKNEGTIAQTSPEQQAMSEALSCIQKKKDKGYVETPEEAKSNADKYFKVTLAYPEEEYPDILFPRYLSNKLDGIRNVASKDGVFSRNGKPMLAIPHIHNSLQDFYTKYPNITLDGELYNHDYKDNFNKIVSLVRKSKPTLEDLAESEKIIQYHIFDCCIKDNTEATFDYRLSFMESCKELITNKYIKIVPQKIAMSLEEIEDFYDAALSCGYEGIMIRENAPYIHKRTPKLLKRKPSRVEDFVIAGVVEGVGNRAETVGYLEFYFGPEHKYFRANVKGDKAYIKELLINKTSLIGKVATVKFNGYTPAGIPRFPRVVCIRDYE